MTPPKAPAVGAAVVRGAFIMVALRFVVRLIGLFSTMVLARLLTPADFGVVGTAAIVTGLFAILQNIGIREGLARLKTVDRSHICTAWTLNLITSAAVTLALIASTPLAISWLNEPKLAQILPLLAVTPTLAALGSPGSMTLLRELKFKREFILGVLQKVFTVAATIGWALAIGDYRGLVAGTLSGAVVFLGLTYAVYPYRPTLTLSRWRDFLGFSLWSMVQGGAVYVASTIDEVFVRRLSNTAAFGLYHASRDLSRTLVSEMVAPAATALLPGLAKISGDPVRFSAAVDRVIGVGLIVAAAVGTLLSGLALDLIHVLLGEKWLPAAAFLTWLAFGVAAQTLAGLHRSITASCGMTHVSALLWVLRAVVMVVVCGLTARSGTAEDVAFSFAIASIVLTTLDYQIILWLLGRPAALLRLGGGPLLAAFAASTALRHMTFADTWPLLLRLPIEGLATIAIYVIVLVATWRLRGSPQGAEQTLLANAQVLIARLRKH
jgi:lipopolysaccharide exporter